MADPISIPPPRTIDEIVVLVKQLYNPEYASLVPNINQQLMQLQTSEHAWTLADQLMEIRDTNVRFYAALTFTVKLNNDGPKFDEAKAAAVLDRLVSWFLRCVNEGEKPLVCKKLCTALNTYFTQSTIFWHRALLHVALSFQKGTAVTSQAVEESQGSISAILSSLNGAQVQALLWFAELLAEEVSKLPSKAQKYAAHHNEMKSTVKDASAIMQAVFTTPTTSPVRSEALQAYVTWIHYTQYVWSTNGDTVQPLHDLFDQASACLIDQAIHDDALEHFRDIIDSYPAFFRPREMETIAIFIRDHLRPLLLSPAAYSDPDMLPRIQFIVAFGCGNISQIVQEPLNELMSTVVVQILLEISTNDGVPGDDDQLTIHTIEFWNTYIEYANDVIGSGDPIPPWRPHVGPILSRAVELFWKKLWIPSRDRARSWGSAEEESFKEYRVDATDLIESIFMFFGEEMFHQLVVTMLQSLESLEWRALEASLYCLNKCADHALDNLDWSEEDINAIFQANLFAQVANYQDVPTKTRKTAIETIGSYGGWLENHVNFLLDAIRFLWACLQSAPLVNMAAKSIDKLCSLCRHNLTYELPGFLAQYENLVASQSYEPFAKEKITGAIAAIIQALKPESAKAAPLVALLDKIEADVERALACGDTGDMESAVAIGTTAMECLACVGRGMQVPDDVPINIYEDDETPSQEVNFWYSTGGQAVQAKIMRCFSVLRVVGNQSDAVDAACQTLRSGINESEPGPFVLPPSFTVGFLRQCHVATPALPSVLSIIRQLLMQVRGRGPRLTEEDIVQIYRTVAGYMAAMGEPVNDPSIASECMDTLARFFSESANIFFAQIGPHVLNFTLSAMNGVETFPKRSACDLWTKIIAPKSRAITEENQTRIKQLMAVYGPKVTDSLVRQFSGRALRSELDFLCEPLKALLLHHADTKMWLQQSLVGEAFIASHITLEQRSLYLRQISAAGSDGRKVKDLTKEFWANCRNTVVSYSS